MSNPNSEQQTADELRAKAAQHRADAEASFDRSDTDGFLSQWASGVMAQKADLEATLAEAGGMWSFPALLDLAGNRVPAKLVLVNNRYGYGKISKWCVVDPATDKAVAWVTPATVGSKRSENCLRAKGYVQGTETAPAKVILAGEVNVHAYIVRTDGGYPGARARR